MANSGVWVATKDDGPLTVVRKDMLDEVVKTLMEGLTTDGAHHKQYFLEQALRQLVEDEWVDKAKAEFEWEDGIPN